MFDEIAPKKMVVIRTETFFINKDFGVVVNYFVAAQCKVNHKILKKILKIKTDDHSLSKINYFVFFFDC